MRTQLISYRCERCGKFIRHWKEGETKCCNCRAKAATAPVAAAPAAAAAAAPAEKEKKEEKKGGRKVAWWR